MSTVLGDPGRLEAYTEATVRAVPAALHAVARYGAAVRAYNAAAPNDLGTSVDDNSTPIGAQLDLLAELDRAPAAFAFALRHLDRLQLDDGIWLRARTTQQEWFDALTEAWLDDPCAPVDQLLDDARRSLDTSLRWPWNGGALRTDPTTPQWWSGTAIGTAATAVDKVWREWGVGVRGHHRGGGWWHLTAGGGQAGRTASTPASVGPRPGAASCPTRAGRAVHCPWSPASCSWSTTSTIPP